ncbi:hypothetical protein F5887DRAFT_1137130 [Amanita rubescens]|nr:hypothetical protein F5887DRAFT_1137130 [Amanita rubescens]
MSSNFVQWGGEEFLVIYGGKFLEVNYYIIPPSPDPALPPLPPLKRSSPFFSGREEYLQRLKDHFKPSTEDRRKSFLLHGLGGIGKTQICLRFLERHQYLFSDIFWIDASSDRSIDHGLKQIAEAHKISPQTKPSARSTLQWISKRTNWLVVYDGADGHYSIVEKYLPPGSGGNVLITSKNAGLKRITLSKNSAEVFEMENEEAVSLLLQSALLRDTDHIRGVARKVVSEVGGIPLALAHAGAYMHINGCTIDHYLGLYTKQGDKLMSESGHKYQGALDYKTTTYGTWDGSMEEIEKIAALGKEDALAAQSAISILRTFAFLGHTNIPEEIFKNAAENYFLSGIQLLLSFSLIKSQNQLYSMHQLVHTWARSRLPEGKIADHYHRTRALLTCSVILDYDTDNYEYCKLLAPHIRFSSLHASKLKLESTYYDDEYDRFSVVFHHIGDWNEREKLLLITVKERKIRLGDNHPSTLSSISDLASTYNSQGKLDDAETLQMEIIDARKAELGPDHPGTLASMANLASTYWKQGRWDEAEKLQEEMMNAIRGKLGPNHPNTFTSMANLALTYCDKGKWDEAEKLQVEVMTAAKRKLGLNHPHTITSMANLANTYRNQGRWDVAKKLQVEVMNAREAKLGPDHLDTLTSSADLATTYWCQGRWDEAEKLQVKVMDARKTKLGSDHLQTCTSMASLALTYRNQGRWGKAEKLQVEVMNARKLKLGSDHPDTLSSMADLASTYWSQGRWHEAEKLQVEVLDARKTKLGSDHPDTLGSMADLASTYWSQKKWEEAEKLQVNVMDARKEKLGSDHPQYLTSMASLGLTYRDQEKWNDAHALLSSAVNKMQHIVGPRHPTTLYYMEQLSKTKEELDVHLSVVPLGHAMDNQASQHTTDSCSPSDSLSPLPNPPQMDSAPPQGNLNTPQQSEATQPLDKQISGPLVCQNGPLSSTFL